MARGNDNKGRSGNNSGNKGNKSSAGSKSNTSNRGFASMDEEKQKEIAKKGGEASHGGGREGSQRGSEE